jgi:hypothetical protein
MFFEGPELIGVIRSIDLSAGPIFLGHVMRFLVVPYSMSRGSQLTVSLLLPVVFPALVHVIASALPFYSRSSLPE